MIDRPGSRRAGILVPLFSIPSTRSWGIGEIADLPAVAGWLKAAGQQLLQLLPINEMPPGEASPYSALSAMAIDPQFIALADLEDFQAVGGEASLPPERRAQLEAARLAPAIDYRKVRPLKQTALREAFSHFRDLELSGGTRRAAAFEAFVREQSWWLDDYALYRALHAHYDERSWMHWPDALKQRRPDALEAARSELADDMRFRQYLQWVAGDQWADARKRAPNLALFGDLPFMVAGDSADVWTRQDEFRLDASVGVPPDAFSDTGQDWGLPAYNWNAIGGRDFDWFRHRARRNAALYDGYRVDHLVGFFRTFIRPHDGGPPYFDPPDEASQRVLGERILSLLREAGAEIIAEDLGTVPDFVRASLQQLGVPGFKVLRWERLWHAEGHPFKDPLEYPSVAVATSGTHDTEPLIVWWEGASRDERAAVLDMSFLRRVLTDEDRAGALDGPGLTHAVHDALLEVLYASGADLLILPIQDVFAWRDRINQPATVSDGNWTWRLPWPSDRLPMEPDAMARATQLKAWAERHGRLPTSYSRSSPTYP